MDFVTEHLEQLVAEEITSQLISMPASARQRIDNVSLEQSRRLLKLVEEEISVRSESVDECYYILNKTPESEREISYERAVELRNHADTKLMLFVPSGSGAAQSSLDNTFTKTSLSDFYAKVGDRLISEYEQIEDLGSAVLQLQRALKPNGRSQEWVEFLVSLNPNFEGQLGENLWRIGLIPDLGLNPESRFDININAVKAISRPIAPSSSLDARFTKAGVPESDVRQQLLIVLGNEYLSNTSVWSKKLLDNHRGKLTFETWSVTKQSPHSLTSIQINNFIDKNGLPTKNSKLVSLEDGVLMAPMTVGKSEELIGRVGVNWITNPGKTDIVAKWKIELTVPNSIREITNEDFVISEMTVAGSKRSTTFELSLAEDDLRLGKRFTFVVTGIDQNGQPILLDNKLKSSPEIVTSDEIASAESQEFVVEVHDIETTAQSRKEDASSIAEAKLNWVVAGAAPDSTEEISWDQEGQVLIYRYDSKYVSQIRTNSIILALQKMILEKPSEGLTFSASNSGTNLLKLNDVESRSFVLPKQLIATRKKFLEIVSSQGSRGLMEAVNWSSDLQQATFNYASSYKKALDSADGQLLTDLLRLDTLNLNLRWGQSRSNVLVTLPIHPLRALWSSKHSKLLTDWSNTDTDGKFSLKQLIDTRLVSRLSPANLPYITVDADLNPMVYFGEITQGASIHIPANLIDSEALVSTAHTFLGYSREGSHQGTSASRIGDKIEDFIKLHEKSQSLSFISVNPGDGAVLADAIRKSLPETLNLEKSIRRPFALKVQAFSQNSSFTNPVSALQKLQGEYRGVSYEIPPSHLVPPFSLSDQPLSDLLEQKASADLALIQNLAGTSISSLENIETRAPYVNGLIIPTVVVQNNGKEKTSGIFLAPALESSRKGDDTEITLTHLSHQRAVGRALEMSEDELPVLKVEVDHEQIEILERLHSCSDWVLSLDRNAGLAVYEDVLKPEIEGTFLIDYAPDFIEGVGDRLTVTSTNRGEVEKILQSAMNDLNLKGLDLHPGRILEILASVSGKLTMRLLEPNTLAREAVGLAALVAHLDIGNKLEDTIVIPVDAHPEIFHPATRGPGENGLRCDLILARIKSNSFKLELIEVKARASAAVVDPELNKHIADQLIETRRLLLSTVFAMPSERPDSQLQWARALSLLHFYADRAIRNGHFSTTAASKIHSLINKLEDNPDKPIISMAGYVVSVDEGDAPEPIKRDDVTIKYLRAADVRQLGKTSQQFHEAPAD